MNRSIYNSYLDALGISKRKPSLAALTEIIKAHLKYVPFENISKLYYIKNYNAKSIPDFEQYVDGIRNHNYGGTCYSNNYYMNRLLDHLGYNVRLCGADMSNPDVHLVNIVEIENREYLVDVGYAAPFFEPIPLYLADDFELTFGNDKYLVKPRDEQGYSKLQLIRDGEIKHGYNVNPRPRSIIEFEKAIKDSMKGNSTFLNAVLLVKYGKNSSVRIHNLTLTEIDNSEINEIPLKDKDELIEQINSKFGISKNIAKDSLSLIKDFNDAWD